MTAQQTLSLFRHFPSLELILIPDFSCDCGTKIPTYTSESGYLEACLESCSFSLEFGMQNYLGSLWPLPLQSC